MLYLIGLALAFIFGWIMRGERESWKIDDTTPLDIKLTEQDLLESPREKIDVKDMAIIYPYKGGTTGN